MTDIYYIFVYLYPSAMPKLCDVRPGLGLVLTVLVLVLVLTVPVSVLVLVLNLLVLVLKGLILITALVVCGCC